MPVELLIIVFLSVINGVFSMSEASVFASRRARLQRMAERGSNGAKAALHIIDEPNRFLSTVQVFITLIGIVGGAFGGATIANEIADALRDTPLAPYADALGFTLIIIVTTYLSLIVGELVPKRLALRSPERIAALIALPMQFLSKLTAPIVKLLSLSTDVVLWLLGARESEEALVTEEEITTMIQQGVEAGVFEESEQDMVESIFRLGDRRINSLMTPRTEITWINIEDTLEEQQRVMIDNPYSRYPLCDGDLDHVVGMVEAKHVVAALFGGKPLNFRALAIEPNYVPESMAASKVLDLFRKTGVHMALVIGEYGGLEGLVTAQDIFDAIVGESEEPQVIQRTDGTWLLDGTMSVDELKDYLEVESLPGEHDRYQTLSGFVMTELGHIPKASDTFEWGSYRFEVVDMDGMRVDKVLLSRLPPEGDEAVPTTDPAP